MVIAKGERVSLSYYPQNLQMVKCPKDMLHIAIDLNYGYFIDFLKENLRSKRLDHVLGRKYYRKFHFMIVSVQASFVGFMYL